MKKKMILNAAAVIFAALSFNALNQFNLTTSAMESAMENFQSFETTETMCNSEEAKKEEDYELKQILRDFILKIYEINDDQANHESASNLIHDETKKKLIEHFKKYGKRPLSSEEMEQILISVEARIKIEKIFRSIHEEEEDSDK